MFKNIAFFIGASIFIFSPHSSNAQYGSKMVMIDASTSYDEVVMPEFFSTSVKIDNDDVPPEIPVISTVKFLKIPPLTGNRERVSRLIEGIGKDVPPEYDHYGYEIRRYMADSVNTRVFEDNEYLIEQIKNVRKAKVIASYWQKLLESEIAEIEEMMANDGGIAFSVRTAFKQNKAMVRTFLISLNSWIDANENLLMYVLKDPNIYDLLYPEIIIIDSTTRREFYNFYTVKQTKLIDIKIYTSFAMMIH